MIRKYLINDPLGIHARPASLIVGEFVKTKSNVTITAKGQTVNGKSIITVMGLGLKQGDNIEIYIDGEDAGDVFSSIEKISQNLTPHLLNVYEN